MRQTCTPASDSLRWAPGGHRRISSNALGSRQTCRGRHQRTTRWLMSHERRPSFSGGSRGWRSLSRSMVRAASPALKTGGNEAALAALRSPPATRTANCRGACGSARRSVVGAPRAAAWRDDARRRSWCGARLGGAEWFFAIDRNLSSIFSRIVPLAFRCLPRSNRNGRGARDVT